MPRNNDVTHRRNRPALVLWISTKLTPIEVFFVYMGESSKEVLLILEDMKDAEIPSKRYESSQWRTEKECCAVEGVKECISVYLIGCRSQSGFLHSPSSFHYHVTSSSLQAHRPNHWRTSHNRDWRYQRDPPGRRENSQRYQQMVPSRRPLF